MPFGRRPRQTSLEGPTIKARAGDTWSSLALKHYGDAMLGAALAQVNDAAPLEHIELGKVVVLPNPDVLNRYMNEAAKRATALIGPKPLHVLPPRVPEFDEENPFLADARARLARARAGMALHAKGGGWQPISTNKPEDDIQKKKRKRPAPELEDRWLRRLARLSPRSAMKVARESVVGIGPTLSFLGGLRDADSGSERMELAQRFLQAYGNEAHTSMRELLRAVNI